MGGGDCAVSAGPGNGPDLPAARYNLGNALASQRRFEEAIVQYRRALKTAPDDRKTYEKMAAALQWRDRIEEAIARFARMVENEPGQCPPVAALPMPWGSRAAGRGDRPI